MKKKMIKMNTKDKLFKEGETEFLNWCKIRNLRPATIKHYQDIIDYSWYKFFNYNRPIKDITPEILDDYIVFCKKKSIKDISINTNIRGIRTVLYFFMSKGYMQEFKIKCIKQDKEIIETYTDSEILILIKKPDLKSCNFTEYRNWVIINYLLSTGSRAESICSLKLEDIDFINGLVKYTHTKNRKHQILSLNTTIINILQEYIIYLPENEEYLFPSTYGGKLKARSLSHTLQKYNNNRFVVRTGVHLWRHTFVRRALKCGIDVFSLQRQLQHSDLTVCKNYIEIFAEDLRESNDKWNPLDNILNSQENVRKKIKLK